MLTGFERFLIIFNFLYLKIQLNQILKTMLNIDIDFYTYTINHPEYLKATYNNFVKY